MKGKGLLAVGSVIFLGIAGGAIYWWWAQNLSEAQNKPVPASQQQQPQQPANPTFFGNEVSLNGTLQAQKVINVASPIDGTIQEVMADAGTNVFQGQVIARIKNGKLDTTLEAAVAEVEKLKTRISALDGSIVAARLESSRAQADALRAKSELDKAEKAYNRQSLLYKEGATPRLTYERSEREFKQAQVESANLSAVARSAAERIESLNKELETAKKLLEQKNQELDAAREDVSSGEVQAPADGTVLARKGNPGEQITKAVQDFFQIALNTQVMQAVVEADPSVAPRIREGQQATVQVAEFPEPLPGVVREIKASTVIVEFSNPSPEVKPGLTARVKIRLQ